MPLFHTDSITLPDQSAAGSGTVDLTVFPFEVVRRAVGSLLGFLHDGLQSGWDLDRYDRVGRTLAAAARRRGLVARVLDRMLTACGPLPLDEVVAGLARATRYAPASTRVMPARTLLAYLGAQPAHRTEGDMVSLTGSGGGVLRACAPFWGQAGRPQGADQLAGRQPGATGPAKALTMARSEAV